MDYRCITTLGELQGYLSPSIQLVAFDFETAPTDEWRCDPRAALDPHKAEIVGVSLSISEGTGVYMPLRHRTGKNADPTALLFLTERLFYSRDIVKVAHNMAFEAAFLYKQGILLRPPVYDTMVAAQLTLKSNKDFRTLADSGLKTLVPRLFDSELLSFLDETGGGFFDELNPQDEETVRYACADADYALQLYHVFNGWFDRFMPKHRALSENIESPTAVYTGLMKCNGIKVDKQLMERKKCEADAKLTKLREDIAFLIGDVDLGANASTAAFKNYLYKDMKLPVLKTTAKNKEAADDEALQLLRDWCKERRPKLLPLFEFIQEYRKWGKLKSTYIDGYLAHINEATGAIHPDLFPIGTDTGRFACRKPNLQNMGRKGNDPVGVRDFFVAREGHVFLDFDFSQIELRVGAYYCRDKRMLETYVQGGDIHAQTTALIYHIPFEQAADKNAPDYKERRTIAKNCNFGVFFGLFAKGLQRNLKFKAGLDIPLSECETIISNLKRGYPGLVRWQNETISRARQRKYSLTALGRRRTLKEIDSPDWATQSYWERCALNTPIQGTAADILKIAMARILDGLPERLYIKPLLQVHDELLFEVPEDKVTEAAAFIRECMEQQPFPEFDLPVVAEGAIGTRFGTLKEME